MKIVWSVDLFEKNPALFRMGGKLADAVATPRSDLCAVYVASPNASELSLAFDVPAAQRFEAYPLQLLKKKISQLKAKKKIGVSAASDTSLSVSSNVSKLLAVAKKQKAQLLMLGSQSRRSLLKIVFGSFAETLIQASDIDVLLYRDKFKLPKSKLNHIVFLHDFSKNGDEGFNRAVAYAKEWKCSLSCFHVPGIFYAVSDSKAPADILKYKQTVATKTKQVEGILKKEKLTGTVHIGSEKLTQEFEEKVQSFARRIKADMIVMGPQKNRFGFLSISKVRRVMGAVDRPLLILKR